MKKAKKAVGFFILCIVSFPFGTLSAQFYNWAKTIGPSGYNVSFDIEVDQYKNVYITGRLDNNNVVDFDPGPGTANLMPVNYGPDIFFAKYDPMGNYIWAKSIGSTSTDIGYDIAVDNNGNVYITGWFYGTADFDPGIGVANLTPIGDFDIFFAKYDSLGNYIWAKRIGSAGDDRAYGMAVDDNGNIIITGTFQDTVDFDPDTGSANLSSVNWTDIFCAKYNTDGNFIWAKGIGSTGGNTGFSVDVDYIGNVYMSGGFQGTVDFDPDSGISNLSSAGSLDAFFVKFDTAGNFVWANKFGGPGLETGYEIRVDDSGIVYATGVAASDIFFAKYDASGNNIWLNIMGSSSIDIGRSIAIDDSSNVYLTGVFGDTCDFNPDSIVTNILVSPSPRGIFFAKYDSSGAYLWAETIGSGGWDLSHSIALDNNRNLYITGEIGGPTDFDPGVGVTTLDQSIFMAKYSPCQSIPQTTSTSTICENDSILLGGYYRKIADTYYDILTGANGCDSLHATILNVDPAYNISDSAVVLCTGDSILIYGTYRTSASTYYDSSSTTAGCDSIHSTVLISNPIGDAWTQKADFGGTARFGATGFSIGNKGYIGTGRDDLGNSHSDLWEYDQASDTWMQKASYGGVPRWGAVGFSIGTKGYIGTGYGGGYRYDFWEYNPATNTWNQKANFGGAARSQAVGFSIGSKGYIGTGLAGSGLEVKDFWEYDTLTNIWTQKTDFGGNGRFRAVGFAIEQRGYIGTGDTGNGNPQKDFWEYNPWSDSWSQKSDFGGAVRFDAVGFAIKQRGYIGVGWAVPPNSYSDDFWEYDPVTDYWEQKANLGGAARDKAVGFSINDKGYIGTGSMGVFNSFSDFWEYNPDFDVSVSKIDITCHGANNGVAEVIIFEGISPYTFAWSTSDTIDSINGLAPGTIYVTVTDSVGCVELDSITIIEPLLILDTTLLAICSDDSIYLQGAYQNSSGVYFDTLLAINGCDSIHTTVLAINPNYNITDPTVIICASDSALIYGIYRTISGIFYDSLSTIDGCDSIHSTVLSVNPEYSINDSALIICNGDSSLIYGTYRTSGGTYYDSLTTVDGCDSVYSTILTVNNTFDINDSAISICNSDSSLIYGTYRTNAGTYYDSFTSVNGCDSVHSTVLSVTPTYDISDSAMTICDNDSSLIYGAYRTSAATYFDSLVTINGCDSIHSTILSVNPTYNISDSALTICIGDSSLVYGVYRVSSGTYFDSLATIAGCDSIHSTSLSVADLPVVTITGLDSVYCSTAPAVALTGVPDSGTFSGIGVANNYFYPTTGVNSYVVTYAYTDSLGCTDSASQSVTVEYCLGIDEIANKDLIKVYPNPFSGSATVKLNRQSANSKRQLQIYDITGRQVRTYILFKSQTTLILQANEIGTGMFFIHLISAGNIVSLKKVVITE